MEGVSEDTGTDLGDTDQEASLLCAMGCGGEGRKEDGGGREQRTKATWPRF